ncbi:MAG: hypothetical protein IJA54_05545 [Tyzzerella sp.]|nr:hypothetical protein [Tyzzerella sp.]
MFDWKNKKSRFHFWGMVISLAILLIVFYATDGWTGDKEFSEYTRYDWSIAILPLSIMAVSGISTLVFSLIIIIPIIRIYPALMNYVINKKFSDIDPGTEFFVFDHNELKRACCRTEKQNGIWISIKEYSLKTKSWTIIEEGRHIEKKDDLICTLQEEYKYDKVKFYSRKNFHSN